MTCMVNGDDTGQERQRDKEQKMKGCLLKLALGECITTFNLENAVCNHGFFMMAPNFWNPSTKTLLRPLRLANSITSVIASISHPSPPDNTFIIIQLHDIFKISLEDEKAILVDKQFSLSLSLLMVFIIYKRQLKQEN